MGADPAGIDRGRTSSASTAFICSTASACSISRAPPATRASSPRRKPISSRRRAAYRRFVRIEMRTVSNWSRTVRTSPAAAFALTLAAGGQEIDLVDYVECRTLTPMRPCSSSPWSPSRPRSNRSRAAQAVVDTIVLSADQPVDPLMAYGGWLAAAQERPSVAGPLSGELEFGPGTLAVAAGVDDPDLYALAEFTNPQPMPDLWDFGIGFRDGGGEEQLRLVVDSTATGFSRMVSER